MRNFLTGEYREAYETGRNRVDEIALDTHDAVEEALGNIFPGVSDGIHESARLGAKDVHLEREEQRLGHSDSVVEWFRRENESLAEHVRRVIRQEQREDREEEDDGEDENEETENADRLIIPMPSETQVPSISAATGPSRTKNLPVTKASAGALSLFGIEAEQKAPEPKKEDQKPEQKAEQSEKKEGEKEEKKPEKKKAA